MWSAWHGHTAVCRLLIESKADVNAQNKKYYGALPFTTFQSKITESLFYSQQRKQRVDLLREARQRRGWSIAHRVVCRPQRQKRLVLPHFHILNTNAIPSLSMFERLKNP